ncbi:MAG: dihydrolipoyl dehydrogenase [Bacteroidales bacterium]
MKYDVIVAGSGPGGYVAAIRAAQLGFKTAVIEKEAVGGICLNWGCIPTKALLKSAQVYNYISHSADYGITIKGDIKPDFKSMIDRSRGVAGEMSKGVQFLLKKNKVEQIMGYARVKPGKKVEVTDKEGEKKDYEAEHIIIATGARSKELPGLKQDGKKIIGYREAMSLKKQPESMVVVGSGAIGAEFAHFYHSIGTKVTLVEYLPNILPLEDEDSSKQLARSFKKRKMKVMTSAEVTGVDTAGKKCKVQIKTKKKEEEVQADIVLSAVGVSSNIEDIGLEDVGIKVENDKITVDEFYRTNVEGYYAIGDVIPGPALAHVASHEGIICVEKIAGQAPEPMDYNNIPGCTYTVPEVASVGYTEKQAKEAGYNIKVGKFPFTASGKAKAAGNAEGSVKVIFDAKYGEWLGAHMVGENVTEMIAEAVVARKLETTMHEIIKAVHPHPTLSEAIMEAAAAANDEVIHL